MALVNGLVCELDQLKNDATDSPHVDGLIILFFEYYDFWSPEPTRTHMATYAPLFGPLLFHILVQLCCNLGLHDFIANLVLHYTISDSFRISATFANEWLWHCS